MTLKKKHPESNVELGENGGNQHFLLFPNIFFAFPENFEFFSHIYFVICKCIPFGPVWKCV